MLYRILFLLALIFIQLGQKPLLAQDKTENSPKDSLQDVALHVDARIAALYNRADKNNSDNNLNNGNAKMGTGSIHSARGYRVLIYSGIDRAKANDIKADFMRKNPGIRVYMTYALPQYKIKVGDFATRQEAGELYRQLSTQYSPCMVVPDIVEINTFRKNESTTNTN